MNITVNGIPIDGDTLTIDDSVFEFGGRDPENENEWISTHVPPDHMTPDYTVEEMAEVIANAIHGHVNGATVEIEAQVSTTSSVLVIS